MVDVQGNMGKVWREKDGAYRLLTNSRVERARDRVLSGDGNQHEKEKRSCVSEDGDARLRYSYGLQIVTLVVHPRKDPCYHWSQVLGSAYYLFRLCNEDRARITKPSDAIF